jgi:hypothetical protein
MFRMIRGLQLETFGTFYSIGTLNCETSGYSTDPCFRYISPVRPSDLKEIRFKPLRKAAITDNGRSRKRIRRAKKKKPADDDEYNHELEKEEEQDRPIGRDVIDHIIRLLRVYVFFSDADDLADAGS